jgi:hypothetical protein
MEHVPLSRILEAYETPAVREGPRRWACNNRAATPLFCAPLGRPRSLFAACVRVVVPFRIVHRLFCRPDEPLPRDERSKGDDDVDERRDPSSSSSLLFAIDTWWVSDAAYKDRIDHFGRLCRIDKGEAMRIIACQWAHALLLNHLEKDADRPARASRLVWLLPAHWGFYVDVWARVAGQAGGTRAIHSTETDAVVVYIDDGAVCYMSAAAMEKCRRHAMSAGERRVHPRHGERLVAYASPDGFFAWVADDPLFLAMAWISK